MKKVLAFTGILSNKANENPDFYNWNRVKLRYCDGASFTGDSQDESSKLYYRGQRIWKEAMKELLSKGMQQAEQFKELFPATTKVKCLSDAGMFMDAVDVSGGHSLRNMFQGVVTIQCFFPQNLVSGIKTPMFLLNAAYDAWQVQESLTPPSADLTGSWKACKLDHSHCNLSQIQFFQNFRTQMVDAVKSFSALTHNGVFINSCFAHCQSERQDTWHAPDSPTLYGKTVAESVGDWYFDRTTVKAIDCPYPCDKTCHDLVFK